MPIFGTRWIWGCGKMTMGIWRCADGARSLNPGVGQCLALQLGPYVCVTCISSGLACVSLPYHCSGARTVGTAGRVDALGPMPMCCFQCKLCCFAFGPNGFTLPADVHWTLQHSAYKSSKRFKYCLKVKIFCFCNNSKSPIFVPVLKSAASNSTLIKIESTVIFLLSAVLFAPRIHPAMVFIYLFIYLFLMIYFSHLVLSFSCCLSILFDANWLILACFNAQYLWTGM